MLFNELPADLLPAIVSFLQHPKHLYVACLVSRNFCTYASAALYRKVSIFSWHRHAKTKVVQLFNTLSSSPSLAGLVLRLEIRDFPKALGNDTLQETVITGLTACVNLRAVTWTRDGSLNSAILNTLQCLPFLTELEINGNSQGGYDPAILSKFCQLRRLGLIMPSSTVVDILISWFSRVGDNLQSLTLICKSPGLITDPLLLDLAPYLQRLEHLRITGCAKVTQKGIWAITSSCSTGLKTLGLEGLSAGFDMAAFSQLCIEHEALSRLESITLTVDHQTALEKWTRGVLNLLSASPLRHLEIYSTNSGSVLQSVAADAFWADIITAHGSRLTRFSVHRTPINLNIIEDICVRCTILEELFITVEQHSLDQLSSSLAKAKHLRVVHINYAQQTEAQFLPVLPAADVLEIVNSCSSTITQFGCNARVWQVARVVDFGINGELQIRRLLSPYESPDIPEAFLVVRI